ncbi:hypothetical protein KFE25_001447 [Diacronema lutheri]|uniref:Uncharacterized protein n=1 Tax=Diacronema lutheri TaxID=2081491 RepID=A0A8J6C6C5_DIALT|nr:hypothetical protein KFE25_001447 [Diacronema lutheri]
MADSPAAPPASTARRARRDAKKQAQARTAASVKIQSVWRGKQARADGNSARSDGAPRVDNAARAGGAARADGTAPAAVVIDVDGEGATRTRAMPPLRNDEAAPAGAAAEGELRRRTPQQRAEAYVLAVAEAAPVGARERLRGAAPCVATCWVGCVVACARVATSVGALHRALHSAPAKLVSVAYGALLCFFGGPFAVSFAAIEAFNAMGCARLVVEARVLQRAWAEAEAADAVDNALDADGDGAADVDALPPRELLARKAALLLAAVSEPRRVQQAAGALLSAWLGALAVLQLRFARAVALALGVARMATPPLLWLLGAPLGRALGPRHAHWAPVLLETLAQAVATSLAWPLERGVSAWYSAMHGGLLAARSLMELCAQLGSSERAPAPLRAAAARVGSPDGTRADEAVGYALFVGGFSCQLASGFELSFPLSVLLLPLLLIEWGLTWQLTWLT